MQKIVNKYFWNFKNICYKIFDLKWTTVTKKEDQALEAGLFDFESLLSQCRPSTLWGIELQRKGVPKGWNDVGGLNEVRRSLLQTLQWPAKVSLVFFNDGSGINIKHNKT